MNRAARILFKAVFLFSLFSKLSAEEILLQYKGSGGYVYIERTDLRRYDNGKYTGLVSREVRSYISPMSVPKGANPADRYYDGNFYVSEGTVRASAYVGEEINNSIPSTFKITSDGQLIMIKDKGYPTFRSFPAFTRSRIKPGDKWQAKAERIVDPLNKGVKTKMPIYVEYTYLRDDVFHEEDVYVISAQWATRYGLAGTLDFGGDRDLKFAQGKNLATILVSKKTGNALVVRDTVDEEFEYSDGKKVAFKGTISMFTEYPPTYNKEKLFPALQRIASVSKEELKKIMDNKVTDDYASGAGKGAEQGAKSGTVSKGGKGSDVGSNSAAASAGTDTSGKKESGNGLSKAPGMVADGCEIEENRSDNNSVTQAGIKESKGGKAAKQDKKSQNSKKRTEVMASAKDTVSKETKETEPKVTVENTEAGIRLTMQNLQFKPDSAELLSGESSRLKDIAELLKMVPEQMILIEGHTASVGNPRGEMQLSLERADTIKKALVKRGVGADKIMVKGSGGTKPVADNSTPQGKAKNRRVEITILD